MAEKSDKKAASASSAGSSGADKRESSKGSGSGGNPAASPTGSSASAGLLSKTPVLLGAAMIIEAVVLFAGFKFVGGGRAASAAGAELALSEGHDAGAHEPGAGASDTSPDDPAKTVEINLLDFKAPNSRSGRNFLYDVSIYVVTRGEHQKTVTQAIQAREALIKDRVRTIIAESDPDKLGGGSEPGLETLRRQIKYQLDEIIGDGLIEEVLIPRCTPYRADF